MAELLRIFSAAFLCASAVYIILWLHWSPRLDTPVEKCMFCGDDPKEAGTFYCACCNSVFNMTGITWMFYQQEVDQISERLK